MKPIDTQWFKGMLADRKISQRQLAKRMEMDPSSMSLLLHGKRHFKMAEAERMAQLVNVRVDEILYRAGLRGLGPGESPPGPHR